MNLNIKHYILFGILILILSICCRSQVVEGYQSYDECVNQGYPLDFCLQVPAQAYIGGAAPVGIQS
jgi:hypothetical protein